jgi:hypothetical protein
MTRFRLVCDNGHRSFFPIPNTRVNYFFDRPCQSLSGPIVIKSAKWCSKTWRIQEFVEVDHIDDDDNIVIKKPCKAFSVTLMLHRVCSDIIKIIQRYIGPRAVFAQWMLQIDSMARRVGLYPKLQYKQVGQQYMFVKEVCTGSWHFMHTYDCSPTRVPEWDMHGDLFHSHLRFFNRFGTQMGFFMFEFEPVQMPVQIRARHIRQLRYTSFDIECKQRRESFPQPRDECHQSDNDEKKDKKKCEFIYDASSYNNCDDDYNRERAHYGCLLHHRLLMLL